MSRRTSVGLGRIREGSDVAAAWRKMRIRPDLADELNSRASQQKVTATTLLNRIVAEALVMSLDGLADVPEVTGETPA